MAKVKFASDESLQPLLKEIATVNENKVIGWLLFIPRVINGLKEIGKIHEAQAQLGVMDSLQSEIKNHSDYKLSIENEELNSDSKYKTVMGRTTNKSLDTRPYKEYKILSDLITKDKEEIVIDFSKLPELYADASIPKFFAK